MRLSGEGGIRTLGTVSRTTVFETATIDRSATSPKSARVCTRADACYADGSAGVAKVKILEELSDSWVELSGLMGTDFWGNGGKCAGLEENQ